MAQDTILTTDTLEQGRVKLNADIAELYADKAPLASPTFTGTPAAPTAAPGTNTTQLATTAFATTADDLKVDKETFATLTDGATVTWNTGNKQNPLAKLTSTQSFTLDMTNVKSGSQGVLKLITNTASAITITFDTDFTNKTLNTTFTTYTFPAITAREYFLSYIVDGTTIEWVIGDLSSGTYQTYVPVWGGFSSDPTSVTARYTVIGKMCNVQIFTLGNGTSNATTTTVSLPIAAANTVVQNAMTSLNVNAGVAGGPGMINTRINSVTADLTRDVLSTAWTNSGNKRVVYINLTYETI